MSDERSEAELAHVAQVAAAAVAFLRQTETRRLALLSRPRVVRTHARLSPEQLDAAYFREHVRNPRSSRWGARA